MKLKIHARQFHSLSTSVYIIVYKIIALFWRNFLNDKNQ